MFSSSNRSHIIHLRSALQSLSKKVDESIDSFIQRAKELKDRLTNMSIVIEDEEMLIYVSNGLPMNYHPFRTSIRVRTNAISFKSLYALSKVEEQTRESKHKSVDQVVSVIAMLSFNRNQGFNQNFSCSASHIQCQGPIFSSRF